MKKKKKLKLKQYKDFRGITELLRSGEIPPEAFRLLVSWASGRPIKPARTESPKAGGARSVEG